MNIDQLINLNWQYWFLQTVAMSITALLLPKLKITSIFGAFTTVFSLSFINSKIWDAALFFHLPDHISVQVLALLLTNGVIFWILVKVIPGIEIEGFFTAFIAPVLFTILSLIIEKYGSHIDWIAVLKSVLNYLFELKNYFLSNVEVPSS